jgi:ribonuclease P protein component
MLPKKNRLTRAEVAHVLKMGTRSRTDHFLIRSCVVLGHEHKYAVIVSKKIEKTSVGRHKIKRAMYQEMQNAGRLTTTNDVQALHITLTPLDSYEVLEVKNAIAAAGVFLKNLLTKV